MVAKGLADLSLANPRLAQPLRLLLSQPIPRQAKSVVFMVPVTPQGKLLFNLIRHVLELRELTTAATMTIDLQRLQLVSQLITIVRPPVVRVPLHDLRADRSVAALPSPSPTPRPGDVALSTAAGEAV